MRAPRKKTSPKAAPASQDGLLVGLHCHVFRHENLYLAECERLGVIDQGTTEAEALRELEVSLKLYLDVCAEEGILDSVLTQRGVWHAPIHADQPLPLAYRATRLLTENDTTRRTKRKGERSRRELFVPAYVWKHSGRRSHSH